MKTVNNHSKEVILSEIMRYEHRGVVARIMNELNINEIEAKELFGDTKKFLFLSSIADKKISPTIPIDEAWHVFLLYTKDYYDFCFKFFGHMVHHRPFDDYENKEKIINRSNVTLQLAQLCFGNSLSKNWDFSTYGQGCCCQSVPLPSCCPELTAIE